MNPQQLLWWRFSLAELMALVTLAAVFLTLWQWAPFTGATMLLFVLPTAIHARRQSQLCAQRGRTLSWKEHAKNVGYSFQIVLMAALLYLQCWFVAFLFFAALLGAFDSLDTNRSMWTAAILGLLLLPIPIRMLNAFKLRPALRLELIASGPI